MNKCFFSGIITDIYNFRFVYNCNINANYVLNFKLNVDKQTQLEILAFDNLIEDIIKLKGKFVLIYAELIDKYQIVALEIAN